MKAGVQKRLDLACDKGKEFEETLRKLELVSKNKMIADILEVVQDLNNDLNWLYGNLVEK